MFYQVDEKLLNKLLLEGKRSIIVVAKKAVRKTTHSFAFIQGKQYKLFIESSMMNNFVQAQVESGSRELISAHGALKLMSKYKDTFLWHDESISEKYFVVVDFSINPKKDFISFHEEWKREKVGQKLNVLMKQSRSNNIVRVLFKCRGSEDLKILQGIAERMYWSGITNKHDTDIQIDVDLAEYDFFNRYKKRSK